MSVAFGTIGGCGVNALSALRVKLMGDLVNSKRVKQTGWVIVVLVVALNIWLLVGTALGL